MEVKKSNTADYKKMIQKIHSKLNTEMVLSRNPPPQAGNIRNRQSIRRIVRFGDAIEIEEYLEGVLYLFFKSGSISADSFFYLERGVLHDGNAFFGEDIDDRATSLGDVDAGFLIIEKKKSLDPADIGAVPLDQSLEIRDYIEELEGKLNFWCGLDHAEV